jgi:hypothetical protein
MTATPGALDSKLRLWIYGHFLRKGRAPTVAEMAKGLKSSLPRVRAALERLCQTHAFVFQENGELWRAAPFSAIPTAFPVTIGKGSWYGNCIWDALGIAAMLHKDARIDAACGCCNHQMVLHVKDGALVEKKGTVHFAVPARDWYQDIVFT